MSSLGSATANRLIQLAMMSALKDPLTDCPIEEIIKDDQELVELVAQADDGDITSKYHLATAKHWYYEVCVVRKEEQYKQCLNDLKQIRQDIAKQRIELEMPPLKRQRK